MHGIDDNHTLAYYKLAKKEKDGVETKFSEDFKRCKTKVSAFIPSFKQLKGVTK